MDMHEIAKLLVGDRANMRLRQGTVTAVASDGTLSVTVGGGEVVVTGVRAFDSVVPTVGGGIWLVTDGVDLIAIGSVGPPRGVTGTVEAWGGSVASIPAGSLLCDGASYLRSAYPTLFAKIGTTWGAVDGTHFNVPPKDRFYVAGGGTYAAGATGGEATHLLTGQESGIKRHKHSGVYAGYTAGVGTSTQYCVLGNTAIYLNDSTQFTARIDYHADEDAAVAHNNLPPYAGLPFIIWT